MRQPEIGLKSEVYDSLRGRLSRLTSFIILLFCFLIFPGVVIFSSLDQNFRLKTSVVRHEKLEQMKARLEKISVYTDNRRYLHLLLKRIFDLSTDKKDPLHFLGRNVKNIHSMYPDDFKFVLWNGKGQIIREYTDEKGYQYILRKLFETLKDVSQALRSESVIDFKTIPSLNRNLNLLRQYLGKIFIPSSLVQPYLEDGNGGPVLSDFASEYSSFWYQIGNNAGIFCFMTERLLNSSDGLVKIIRILNDSGKDYVHGFTRSPDIFSSVVAVPEELSGHLSLALAEFENFAEPLFENDQVLILIRQAQPGIKIFCVHKKSRSEWSVDQGRDIVFARIIAMLVLFYSLITGVVYMRRDFISIRWKLTGLFLFANLAPIVVMAFIAHDYLNVKSVSLKNDIFNDLSIRIREFDNRFASVKRDIADSLNNRLEKINQVLKGRILNSEDVSEIEKIVRSAGPSHAYLISSHSAKLLEIVPPGTLQKFDFVPALGAAILKFNNGIVMPSNKSDVYASMLSPEDSDFIRKSFRDQKRLVPVNMGDMQKLCYWYIFGDSSRFACSHFLLLVWDDHEIQQRYVNGFYEEITSGWGNSLMLVANPDGGQQWPPETALPKDVLLKMQKNDSYDNTIAEIVELKGFPHLMVSFKGRNLDRLILASAYPQFLLEQQISSNRNYILSAGLLSILLTLIICNVLSGQFLRPVADLRRATLAIGSQDFSHRISVTDEDEFGHLNLVFNRVIEGLGELEVARIVQENLFPGNHFCAGSFRIFGKSVVMTKLGGDYYDCFEIDENHWGVVVGDVAGHGVPAGLMMAMAKAGVLVAGAEEKSDASTLTLKLHSIFLAIKNKHLKRMMTFQYFVINLKEGLFSFANAGHCFPCILRPRNNTAELIEHVAMPLGISARARYENSEFLLGRGEALVLYTDGIAEAKNASGEEFGYERLKALLLESYDDDPELFYNKVYSAYEAWAACKDDDLTIIIITNPEKT